MSDEGKKKRRVPAPRKKGVAPEGQAKKVPPRRKAPGKAPGKASGADPVAAGKAGASQNPVTPEGGSPQAAAQQAAAQQAAAQQAAAKQAAAQQAAAKQAAAQQAAAKQAAAQQAAAQQAAAKQAALQKAAAVQQAAAKQEALKRAAAQQAAGQQAAGQQAAPTGKATGRAPGKTPGKTPAKASGKAPSRATRSGRTPARGASSDRTQPRKMAKTGRRQPVKGPLADGDEDVAEQSKSLPLILGGVGVVLVIAVIGFLMSGGDTPVEPVVKKVAKAPVKSQKEIREERARKALDRAEKENAAEPGERFRCAARLRSVAMEYSNTTAGAEAGELRSTLLNTWRTEVDGAWNSLRSDVLLAFSEARFEQASRLLEELPPVFLGASQVLEGKFEQEIVLLKKDAKAQLLFKKQLDELSTKAGFYARKGYEDIALAVIEALPEKVQEDAPDVWRLKEELIQKIQREGLTLLMEQESALEAEIAEARRLEKERKAAERIRRWLDMRDSVAWKPLLGKSNLYNWVASSDRMRDMQGERTLWRVMERNGEGVLLIDNRSGSDSYTGVYSNHWEDYLLEFELNLKVGALRISPRTQADAQRGAITDGTSPPLELGDDFPKNRWLKVTLEVHGKSVTLRYGDGGDKIELDPETTRLPSSGGFVFYAADGTRLEIRGVRVKIVNDTREGGIFAK